MATIRNPVEWVYDLFHGAFGHATSIAQHLDASRADAKALDQITVRRIQVADLGAALRQGYQDFQASRSDVLMLSLVYPVVGLALWWIVADRELLPLVVPLVTGFALLGPVAAVGLYEMSRKREAGHSIRWLNAFDILRHDSFTSIAILGLLLLAVFGAWLWVAYGIYTAFLGPDSPTSARDMLETVLYTKAGWTMAVVGTVVGFVFAVVVLAISVVSFPMLVDKDVGPSVALVSSVEAVLANKMVMALWGLIVAVSLFIATIPLLLGMIVVMPILGHATWHLYRKLVSMPPSLPPA